mgnify:CR=1 FL=1
MKAMQPARIAFCHNGLEFRNRKNAIPSAVTNPMAAELLFTPPNPCCTGGIKILITQLSHQDPTQPMQDKDFIAQMAQFSSLEQITNMSQGMGKLATLLARSQALGLLGSTVDVGDAAGTVSGLVEEVTGGDYPQVLVNGRYYDFSQVLKVKREAKE